MRKIKIPAKIKSIFTKKRIIRAGIIIAVIALLYFGRSLIVATWVNGRPIFRLSLITELERQGGRQVLDNLVDKALVDAEAKKQKIVISKPEIDTEIANVEAVVKEQGLTLEDALKFRNQTVEDLKTQIEFQKTVEKLLSSKISVTDAEIKDYFDKNKSTFAAGSTLEKVKDEVKTLLIQQKLSEEYTKWIADLKAKAKIYNFVSF